jgi:GNAT superfamily N-acetyltransferase
MIQYKPFSSLQAGDIFLSLQRIYQDYPYESVETKNDWETNWIEYDKLVFSNMATVGRAGFASFVDDQLIGFCSWDSRKAPECIIVGHNGVLPEYRGQRYGIAQINKMLELFRKQGYQKAYVTTGENDFFVPAQKMYTASRFVELERLAQNGNKVIKYIIQLS